MRWPYGDHRVEHHATVGQCYLREFLTRFSRYNPHKTLFGAKLCKMQQAILYERTLHLIDLRCLPSVRAAKQELENWSAALVITVSGTDLDEVS